MQVSECNERLSDLQGMINRLRIILDLNRSTNELTFGHEPLQTSAPLPSSSVLSPLNLGPASVPSFLPHHHDSWRARGFSRRSPALEHVARYLDAVLKQKCGKKGD
jgi:hypothetical protein